MLFKKFCTGLITGLMKDLAGLFNSSGSSYIKLPVILRSSRKGLINIKNNNQKCFYGVMLDILIL